MGDQIHLSSFCNDSEIESMVISPNGNVVAVVITPNRNKYKERMLGVFSFHSERSKWYPVAQRINVSECHARFEDEHFHIHTPMAVVQDTDNKIFLLYACVMTTRQIFTQEASWKPYVNLRSVDCGGSDWVEDLSQNVDNGVGGLYLSENAQSFSYYNTGGGIHFIGI